ncbi:hypothetical protein SUDANB171_03811 [Streptomyces sp. enrichment culture]|jgi:hypothetical protein|uniref:DUF397 domain-containing protein n=1 Tax=Streptomyces xiamenensis TaxID=408015 RepID=UPI0037D77541
MEQNPHGPVIWRRSSYSSANGQCVEIAELPQAFAVVVRDSKDTSLPGAVLPGPAWTAFLNHLKG